MVTDLSFGYALGQGLHGRKTLDRRGAFSELGAVIEVGLDRDLTLAVIAVDLGRTGLEGHICHGIQRDSLTRHRRHAKGLDGFQVAPAIRGQTHANRDPALAIVQLGNIGVNITDRGHPGRLSDRLSRNTQARRLCNTWANDNFWATGRRGGARIGKDR